MSKKIHVLIFSSAQQKLLTFAGNLPYLETEKEDTFLVAIKCIEDYVNASCCLMSRLHNTETDEVWQALEVFLPEDKYWQNNRVSFAWKTVEELEEEHPELEVSKWKKIIYKKNLAIQIAEKIEKEHWENLEQQISERA